MCLIVKNSFPIHATKFTPAPYIAEKPIEVLKLLNEDYGRLVSPYWEYEYELGKLVTAEIDTPTLTYGYFGRHYFSINKGLHSYKESFYDSRFSRMTFLQKCFNAIIPEGSLYYFGDDFDIVSNQLIVLNKYGQ